MRVKLASFNSASRRQACSLGSIAPPSHDEVGCDGSLSAIQRWGEQRREATVQVSKPAASSAFDGSDSTSEPDDAPSAPASRAAQLSETTSSSTADPPVPPTLPENSDHISALVGFNAAALFEVELCTALDTLHHAEPALRLQPRVRPSSSGSSTAASSTGRKVYFAAADETRICPANTGCRNLAAAVPQRRPGVAAAELRIGYASAGPVGGARLMPEMPVAPEPAGPPMGLGGARRSTQRPRGFLSSARIG